MTEQERAATRRTAHRYLTEHRDDYEYLLVFGGKYRSCQLEFDTWLCKIVQQEPCDAHVMLVLLYACSSLDPKVLNPDRFNEMALTRVEQCENITEQMVHDLWDVIKNAPKRMAERVAATAVDKQIATFQKQYGRYLCRLRLHKFNAYMINRTAFRGIMQSHVQRMESGTRYNNLLHALATLKFFEHLVLHGLPEKACYLTTSYAELTEENVARLIGTIVHGLKVHGILTDVPGTVHIRHDKEDSPCTDARSATL